MMNLAVKVLWVDDHISLLMPYCEELRKRGMRVETASSADEALLVIQSDAFDLFLIDLKMPGRDGVQLLRSLARIQFEKPPIFVAFSSFLYVRQYRERLRGLDVALLDKDFPPTDSVEFEQRFITPILEIAKKGAVPARNRNGSEQKVAGIDPFALSFSDFLNLGLAEKEMLLDKAEKIAASTIDAAFAAGKIWVLLCGSPTVIAASAESARDFPNEERILEYARQMDSPPYQFFKAPQVDCMWMSCSAGYYPTVTIELSSPHGQPSGKMDVHLDTGAPMSFYSYEELLERGVVLPSQLLGKTRGFRRRGHSRSYRAYPLKQDAILECQSGSGATRAVTLNGQIVRGWSQGPYARHCDKPCPHGGEGAERLCVFRKALIGNNLMTDNELSLVLDGESKITRFEKKTGRKS